MKAFYSIQFVLPLPPGHRFPMGKYARLRGRLGAGRPGVTLAQAEPASDAELALARGKQAQDKRQTLAKRDSEREISGEMGRRAKGKI